MSEEVIRIKGARVHNLKNIQVEVPLGKLTVITGVSGSGKSSLAFDTIYAEGQRRYVESLSAYARQFLERMDKPDVDEISGICPAISIRQKNATRNPRSTVATQTEIFDYLRLLFARIGKTFCARCGNEVLRDTPDSIANEVLQLAEGTRFYVLFPASAGFEETQASATESNKPKKKAAKKSVKKSAASEDTRLKAHLMSLMQRGFTRLYKDGRIIDLQTPDSYTDKNFTDTFVLVDRLVAREDVRARLVDSIETCYQDGHGQAVIETVSDAPVRLIFSEAFACKSCGIQYAEPEPRLFSFNNPFGACPTCQGFGNTVGLDFDLVIPNRELSLAQGAVDPFTKPQYANAQKALLTFCKRLGIPTDVPFRQLSAAQQKMILHGGNGYEGINGFFEELETKKYKLHVRVFLSKYRGYTRCPECAGGRLRLEARIVRIQGKNLPEICALTAAEAADFFSALTLNDADLDIAERLLYEIRSRLRFLLNVGLEYLTLDRLASTLSGGEAQRIQLATNLGASLVGALYVLDEPSIGLHPRDSQRLIHILENLRDIGNTVLVVEHEPEMMIAADKIIDIGPGAGELGGEVVFQGTTQQLINGNGSLTGKYLRGDLQIKLPKQRRPRTNRLLQIRGASEHNLKGIDLDVPLGMMTCITGVSGSGKSTLVHDIMFAGLKKQRGEWTGHVGSFAELKGGQFVSDVVLVDQSPIGRTPRSNPITYIKVYDAVREAFAHTREAQAHGYDASHFSFNVPGGRCERCEGNGVEIKEMQFLADVELICEECKGRRFKQGILDVKYKGKTIHDVLNMTVREGLAFFAGINRIATKLQVMDDVGLGYLRLGQSATTLSGGEAQRVKLALFLSKRESERMLYIFDEPTTGLHFDDINKLLAAFRQLIEAGGSIIIIEHNLDVIKSADWVIDLGPEGGYAGGQVVAQGTPEEIARCEASHTGRFLKKILANGNSVHRQ
ncbi:MAG: excinuclease ABC subunit UvrA [Acidobacteria bacterium]|nr:excinuclease ABC subunit UvrA [Acidobacteriota bacterium]